MNNSADTPKTVTIKASWMAACGYAAIDTECDVIRLAAVTPSGDRFFDVTLPNGRVWTVASFRLVNEGIAVEVPDHTEETFYPLADMDAWEEFYAANREALDDMGIDKATAFALACNCCLLLGGGAAPLTRVGFVDPE